MVAFEINVAGVIARRGYPMLRQPGAPAFLAWVGAPGGNPRPAPGGADMECLHAMRTLSQWRHTQVTRPMWFPSSKTCSACGTVNPDLKRGPMWNCPSCGTQHDRNLNAAINLRNLIIPAGRHRNGRGQEAVAPREPWDSRHGEPGIVKDGPPLWDRGRGTDTRTKAEGPARGSWDDRAQNAAINPIVTPRRRQNGQGHEDVPEPGPVASRQGHPSSVPKRKPLPVLEGRERETQARRPEAWRQGSPKTDRNNQPGKPGHSLRQGAGLRDAGGG